MDPLARREDKCCPGNHANTQVPKVVGAIRQFELGCDSSYYTIADFFWNTVRYTIILMSSAVIVKPSISVCRVSCVTG